MYLALSKKLRFLITEAVMQEEEEHSFLNARSDEDKRSCLAFTGQLQSLPLQPSFVPVKRRGGRREKKVVINRKRIQFFIEYES
jgi:hypothetical protein